MDNVYFTEKSLEIEQYDLQLEGEKESYDIQICLIPYPQVFNKETIPSFLSVKESNYFSTLKYEKRAKEFYYSRLASKLAISKLTGETRLSAIHIEKGIFYYPIVMMPGFAKTAISISHCDVGAVALAFEETILCGIDFEYIEKDKEEVINNILTDEEKGLVESSLLEEHVLVATILWTAREALSKVIRTGFTVSLEILSVKKLTFQDGIYISEFKYFSGFIAKSVVVHHSVLTLVYPKHLILKKL